MGYRWILFDADDTLFDFDRAAAEALRETLVGHDCGFDEDHVGIYARVNAHFWQAFERGEIDQRELRVARFGAFLAEIGHPGLDAVGFSRAYESDLSTRAYLLEGVMAMLRAVAEHAELALITNGLQSVQRPRLEGSPVIGFFREIVISEEVGVAKPHAGIFEIAFESMGRPDRSDVLIVGDSLSSDIQGGSDFGIDTCWYNPHGRPCDPERELVITHEIRALEDLVPICVG